MMAHFIIILVAAGYFQGYKKVLYRRSESCFLLDFASSEPIISSGTYEIMRGAWLLQ